MLMPLFIIYLNAFNVNPPSHPVFPEAKTVRKNYSTCISYMTRKLLSVINRLYSVYNSVISECTMQVFKNFTTLFP